MRFVDPLLPISSTWRCCSHQSTCRAE